MFNKIAYTASILLATACGSAPQASQAKGSVNNGPIGPTHVIVSCEQAGGAGKFSIITFNGGSSLMGGVVGPAQASLACTQSPPPAAQVPDANQALYSCTDTRGGEGMISVDVYRQGNSGVVMANVYRDSFLGTEPASLVMVMSCN